MAWKVTTEPAIEPVSLEEIKRHLRLTVGDDLTINNAAAVDKTGGKVGIPVTGHGLSTDGGDWITIEETTNYDGSYRTTSDTTTNEIVIEATYAAETFAGTEPIYINGEENDLLVTMLKAAREWCESFQNRAFISQTITLTLDEFPDTFTVPKPRLQSVTSIKYIDTDGAQQTLSSDVYDVDSQSEPARIALAYSQSWPSIRGDINSVEVIYVAGYGDAASNIPDRVKAAIKLLAGHLYEHREMVSEVTLKEVPFAVKSLLSVDRVQIV